MSDKVTIYRGGFGTWFAATKTTEVRPGVFRADKRLDIENQDQLTAMSNDADLWRELSEVSDKTPEEIFDACGLTLTRKP